MRAPPNRAKPGTGSLYAKGSPAGCIEPRVRRVILTERSEVDSESRRQPAVFFARSTGDARHEPPSSLSFRSNPRAGESVARGWQASRRGAGRRAGPPER
jgi:hypothetical protein